LGGPPRGTSAKISKFRTQYLHAKLERAPSLSAQVWLFFFLFCVSVFFFFSFFVLVFFFFLFFFFFFFLFFFFFFVLSLAPFFFSSLGRIRFLPSPPELSPCASSVLVSHFSFLGIFYLLKYFLPEKELCCALACGRFAEACHIHFPLRAILPH